MTSAAQVIGLARSQVGIHENPANSNNTKFGAWYGMNYNAWCFMFVSWVFYHAGHPLPNMGSSRGGSYTPTGVAWGKAHGLWSSSGRYAPADLIFYTWGTRGGLAQHVGIVAADDGNTIHTIEGNVGAYGGSVERKSRPHNSSVLGVVKTSKILTSGGVAAAVHAATPVHILGVPADNGLAGHPTVQQGSRNNAVLHLQKILVAGWRSRVKVDGDFGPSTAAAVRAFQAYKRVTVDGVVGPQTWGLVHGGKSWK